MNQQNNIKRNYCLSRLILKTDSPKDEHHRDVYKVMKIISATGNTVLNTEDIHFFSDSSEKKIDWPPESPDNQYHLNK